MRVLLIYEKLRIVVTLRSSAFRSPHQWCQIMAKTIISTWSPKSNLKLQERAKKKFVVVLYLNYIYMLHCMGDDVTSISAGKYAWKSSRKHFPAWRAKTRRGAEQSEVEGKKESQDTWWMRYLTSLTENTRDFSLIYTLSLTFFTLPNFWNRGPTSD